MARKILKHKSRCSHKCPTNKNSVSGVVINSKNKFSDTELQKNSGYLDRLMNKAKLALNILQEDTFFSDESKEVVVMLCADGIETAGNPSDIYHAKDNSSTSGHPYAVGFNERACSNTQNSKTGEFIKDNFEGATSESVKPNHLYNKDVKKDDLLLRIYPYCDNLVLRKESLFGSEELCRSENVLLLQRSKSKKMSLGPLAMTGDNYSFHNIAENTKRGNFEMYTKPKHHFQRRSQTHSSNSFKTDCPERATKESEVMAYTKIDNSGDDAYHSGILKANSEPIWKDSEYCSNCISKKEESLTKYSQIHISGSKICLNSAVCAKCKQSSGKAEHQCKTTPVTKCSKIQGHASSHSKQDYSSGPTLSNASSLNKTSSLSPSLPGEITFDPNISIRSRSTEGYESKTSDELFICILECSDESLYGLSEEKQANVLSEDIFRQKTHTKCNFGFPEHLQVQEFYIPSWLNNCNQLNNFRTNEKYSDYSTMNVVNEELQSEHKMHAERCRNHAGDFTRCTDSNIVTNCNLNILKRDNQDKNRKMEIKMPCREALTLNGYTNRKELLLPYRRTNSDVIAHKHYSETQSYNSEPTLMLKDIWCKPERSSTSPQALLLTADSMQSSSVMMHEDDHQLKSPNPSKEINNKSINSSKPDMPSGSKRERKTLAAIALPKLVKNEYSSKSTQDDNFCCRETSETGRYSGASKMATKSCTCGGYTKGAETSRNKAYYKDREKREDDRYINRHSERRSSLELDRNNNGYSKDRSTFRHSSRGRKRFPSRKRNKDLKEKRSSEDGHRRWHRLSRKKDKSGNSSGTSIADSQVDDSPHRRRTSTVGKRYSKSCLVRKCCPRHHCPSHYSCHTDAMKRSASYDDGTRYPANSSRYSRHKADDKDYHSTVESPNKFNVDDNNDYNDICECGCRCWESPSDTSIASSMSEYDPDYPEKRGRRKKSKKKKKKHRCNIL